MSSQFQILSNFLVDNEKNLALYFLLLCQSAYLSVSLGHPCKKLNHPPSVVSWTQWSQHFALPVHKGQQTKGTCRWSLTTSAWACPSFSIFCHGTVSRKAVEKGRLSSSCPLLYVEESKAESMRYIIMIKPPVFRRIKEMTKCTSH